MKSRTTHFKIAYIQRLIYPDSTAAAQQSILMANALAEEGADVTYFIHDLLESLETIKEQYGISGTKLSVFSLSTRKWPHWIYNNGYLRLLTFNMSVLGLISISRLWNRDQNQKQILFVRSRLEFLFWGLACKYLWWLKNWVLIYEAHDLFSDEVSNMKRAERTRHILKYYDLVIAITRNLAQDIEAFTAGQVKPAILSLATGIPRLQYAPHVSLDQPKDKITLGYIGTVDQMRGVDLVLKSLSYLPNRFLLRVVGRISESGSLGQKPEWLTGLLDDPSINGKVKFITPVPYAEVANQIDRCDIVIQPAGLSTHVTRYAAPLKLFDYMARGKPIIAADIPAHQELLQDGVNACLYQVDDPQNLASVILSLAENPKTQQKIATKAWQQSAKYTYEVRAQRILELIEQIG